MKPRGRPPGTMDPPVPITYEPLMLKLTPRQRARVKEEGVRLGLKPPEVGRRIVDEYFERRDRDARGTAAIHELCELVDTLAKRNAKLMEMLETLINKQ